MHTTSSKNATRKVASFYWRHARKYPTYLWGLIIAVPLTMLVNAFLPTLLTASVLSRLSQHQYQTGHIWASFGPQLLLFAVLLLLGHFTWRIVDHFMWRLEMRVQQDLAEEVFDKLLNQTADFHANNFTGSLVSQNSKLLGNYVRLADTIIFQVYPMLCSITFAAIIMAFRAPLFTGLLLVLSSTFMLVAFASSRPVRLASTKFASAESDQTGLLADTLTNSMAVKSFASGVHERQRFHAATGRTHNLLSDFSRTHQRQMNALGTSTRSISAISLAIAVVSVMMFHANIGTVFLILSYTSLVTDQLFSFGNNSLRNFSRAVGDTTEMIDTMGLTPDILDPTTPENLGMQHGLVTFKDVTFTHGGNEDALFEKFNVLIQPGEKVGLVGHSGSGKTTFTRLLLRFSDIQSGQILVDGQDITAVTQDDLRSRIAYVPQEPLLFHRTIQENIAYGQSGATDKQVTRAAKMAHADEFIQTLPQGYQTLVGERGVKLSGGQRQRVAIARAMLKQAPILLLDEATSALDSESEVLIQDALWKLMEGRTAIVIAHRLSTIQKMDRIIVLDDGKIIEQGSHQELVAKAGAYAKLWAHQSGGFIDD
ncbi:ABC transporter ATP-binding protein [Aeromicrobium sp.]|nr:ABC transporter ATP-binding protein [Candidatus Saccharibacteria bacterium]